MTERRYSEDEVAAIFERATEVQRSGRAPLPAADGMTLSDLQDIGREIGVPPELVARAADALDRTERPANRGFIGFPLSIGKTVDLGRRLSDEEWELLVTDLRATFDAWGRVRQEGASRAWTNGNLQILLEPGPTGHRLRMRTLNGTARGWMASGLVVLGIGAAALIATALGGGADPGAVRSVLLLSLLGGGMFGIGAVRLPGWARRRLRQMDEVAERLLAAGARDPSEDD